MVLNGIGEEVEVKALLTEISENSKNGQKWLDLKLSDTTSTISAKMWQESLAGNADPGEMVGKVVSVKGMVELYKGKESLNVAQITLAEEGSYSLSDFRPSLTEEGVNSLTDRLNNLISQISSVPLQNLLKTIFTTGRISQLSKKLGGINHHRYCGGLLAHLVETAELSVSAAKQGVASPYGRNADLDILIAGALLHDIGKLTCLADEPGRLSERGFCVDIGTESVIFATMFNSKLQAGKGMESLTYLNHAILGARGKARSLEAIIIKNADKMSNDLDAYGMAFVDESATKDEGMIAFSKEIGSYLLRGEW